MAVPKAKTSKWRRDQRRAQNFFNKFRKRIPSLGECSNCGERILPHRVCPYCGYYRGKEIISVE
ncbi:MAG TPA: 50S ribosomal protein L32 [Aquifex aeolicus]|nr:50S ribosomal protein L32 [Aquifex aeolicus]